MTGFENQVLACLRRWGRAGACEIARQVHVSPEFVQSLLDRLAKEERIVGTNSAGYALSPSEKRRWERYRHLEAGRKPFVRW